MKTWVIKLGKTLRLCLESVVINKDGGGNYVCFDYRHDPKTSNPRVVFWFHEGTAEDGDEIFKIASSFDEFLDILFDERTKEKKLEDEN